MATALGVQFHLVTRAPFSPGEIGPDGIALDPADMGTLASAQKFFGNNHDAFIGSRVCLAGGCDFGSRPGRGVDAVPSQNTRDYCRNANADRETEADSDRDGDSETGAEHDDQAVAKRDAGTGRKPYRFAGAD